MFSKGSDLCHALFRGLGHGFHTVVQRAFGDEIVKVEGEAPVMEELEPRELFSSAPEPSRRLRLSEKEGSHPQTPFTIRQASSEGFLRRLSAWLWPLYIPL